MPPPRPALLAGPAAVKRGWVYFSEVKFIPGAQVLSGCGASGLQAGVHGWPGVVLPVLARTMRSRTPPASLGVCAFMQTPCKVCWVAVRSLQAAHIDCACLPCSSLPAHSCTAVADAPSMDEPCPTPPPSSRHCRLLSSTHAPSLLPATLPFPLQWRTCRRWMGCGRRPAAASLGTACSARCGSKPASSGPSSSRPSTGCRARTMCTGEAAGAGTEGQCLLGKWQMARGRACKGCGCAEPCCASWRGPGLTQACRHCATLCAISSASLALLPSHHLQQVAPGV